MNEIRYDVPVPNRVTKKRKYFFERFQAGGFEFYDDVKIGTINSTINGHKKRGLIDKSWTFTVRRYKHNDVDGVGVWRTE